MIDQQITEVTVSASRNDDASVQVSVSDTGPGLAPEERERIFEKFYQIADLAAGQSKGTGLGLAISKALVELHSGKIWVESEMNQGSTFYFMLPASAPQSSSHADAKSKDSVIDA